MVEDTAHNIYMDIVNIPKYDVVLGLPFMYQVKMVLDFGALTMRIGNKVLPMLRGREDTENEHSVRTKRVSFGPQRSRNGATQGSDGKHPVMRSFRARTTG